MNVGILRFSALGDLALALPFVRALKVKPVVLTMPAGRELYRDEFETFAVLADKSVRAQFRFVRDVRRLRLDALIDLQSNDRSGLLTRFAGARRIYNRDFPAHVYSATEAWRRILEPSGLLGPLDVAFTPKPRDYIVLNTGSSPAWRSKRLPDAKWREISAVLHERFGLPFVLTGSADEREAVAGVAGQLAGRCENRAGQTSVQELKHLLAGAFLTVSTDSAAMQISAAMKTPTLGLFGATNWIRSAPFGPWSRTVYDAAYYPDGVPPAVNTRECRPFYDHLDIRPALEELAEYLK
ncbi:MAG: glycosyltransferase family 9 protein [Verrucomicrobiota bacterium]|jgi:ADP-heptose:LPS heptosyltransferase|nr:glycosyltransferase family 9 protein [Verrucomicrobiota bacterium]